MQETDYEQGLLGLIQQQPEQGLAEAMKQYGGLVQAVVRRVLGNECQQDVEECTSEVFGGFTKRWARREDLRLGAA